MKTYRTLTSILTLGVMVSCGSDNSRDSATTDTAALTSATLSIDPTTGDITKGDITMGTPTSGMSAGGMTSSDASASGTTSSTSEGRTTDDPGLVNCMCNIQPNGDGIGAQNKQPPPQAFEPVIEWTWSRLGYMITTPLVANLTDDNGDGVVDLCDTPDVVVQIDENDGSHMYALDGSTGKVHFQFGLNVFSVTTPAIGDIDGDGSPEIVTLASLGVNKYVLAAFENDGAVKWTSDELTQFQYFNTFALADLEHDGDVEILGHDSVWDHSGALQWIVDVNTESAPFAMDLDGDGDLEVVLGDGAFHHDGSVYYQVPKSGYSSYQQVANLDADPEPEALRINELGISLFEHTGAFKYQNKHPLAEELQQSGFPATIADFDGDGMSDFAVSRGDTYAVYRADSTPVWELPLFNDSGSGGTAFDFNGDGIFEVVFAAGKYLYVFGNQGQILAQIPHPGELNYGNPIVADVDNDGSAEIVVVSSSSDHSVAATVQVIGDKANRWPQARRIWNQHAYHVTNVNEDGTIPQHQEPSWQNLNTFRVNSTLGSGGSCEPPTPG